MPSVFSKHKRASQRNELFYFFFILLFFKLFFSISFIFHRINHPHAYNDFGYVLNEIFYAFSNLKATTFKSCNMHTYLRATICDATYDLERKGLKTVVSPFETD